MTDVQQLVDRVEITELVNAYARGVDENRPDAVADLFTEDCIVKYTPRMDEVHGREALAKFLTRALAAFRATSHHCSNISIAFNDADHATATVYLYAWHGYLDDRADFHLWGRYLDRLTRTAQGWRIAERRIEAHGLEASAGEFTMIDRR
jgi:uncharacterized protein (TIGR02246 family)